MFLEKKEGKKGICSQAYLEQVLEGVMFPLYDSVEDDKRESMIFMEDGAKVHQGKARLPRLEKGIRGFD